MDINIFVENFANLFEETAIDAFSSETIYKDIPEWNSLLALSIIAMVDEEYDVRVKGDDFSKTATINDLYEIVRQRKNV